MPIRNNYDKGKNGVFNGTAGTVTGLSLEDRLLEIGGASSRLAKVLRRMVATRSASGGIAFYVCNAPGPDTQSQTEIDRVVEEGLDDKNKVACVAMEYTPVTGANGGQPMTKFFTFGPDETLLLSINLDGRGEKFMPGSCVACHGGTTYNGRFPEQASASPFLGSRFLPFDTGNYLFSSKSSLSEASQSEAFYQLNQLVLATECVCIVQRQQLTGGTGVHVDRHRHHASAALIVRGRVGVGLWSEHEDGDAGQFVAVVDRCQHPGRCLWERLLRRDVGQRILACLRVTDRNGTHIHQQRHQDGRDDAARKGQQRVAPTTSGERRHAPSL